jgi:hypothetical protein
MPTITPGTVGAGITPQMPQEPTKEMKEMSFKLDSTLLNNDGDGTVVTNDKGEELKITPPETVIATPDKKVEERAEEKVKEKVEEVKVEEKPKAPILKPPAGEPEKLETVKKDSKLPIKPITPVKEKSSVEDTFDYSKFSPQEVVNLKNMSRQSREYVAKLIEENKNLQPLKDSTYLQHEHGYTLSPDFQELQQKTFRARLEGECWEQALLNIKAGKAFQDIVGFDKNGNAVLGEEKQPTDRDELRISSNLTACSQAIQQMNGELQTFPQQFQQRIQQDLRVIDDVQKEKFAWVADPKLLEYSVNVEGQGDKKVKDIKNDFKSMFPPYLANSPAVDIASNLIVALVIQGEELREARKGQQVETIKRQEVSRGELKVCLRCSHLMVFLVDR